MEGEISAAIICLHCCSTFEALAGCTSICNSAVLFGPDNSPHCLTEGWPAFLYYIIQDGGVRGCCDAPPFF